MFKLMLIVAFQVGSIRDQEGVIS